MSADLVVVGGGLAGLAATLTATALGARVSVVRGGPGASAFSSGAFDRAPWWEVERASRLVAAPLSATPLHPDVARVFDALAHVAITPAGSLAPLLATVSGSVRSTEHRDQALVDLRTWAGRTVLVPRAERALWDADTLARGLAQSCPEDLGIRFEAVDLQILLYADEDRAADAELASRHDDPTRIAWLAERLSTLTSRAERPAVLLGPWLGVDAPRADELAARLGFPVGEALSGVAGAAGARLEQAIARAFAATGAELVPGRASELRVDGPMTRVTVEGERALVARNVIFATGSFLGGGLVHLAPEHAAPSDGPDRVRPPFASAIAGAPAIVALGRRGIIGSLHGPTLDDTAWPGASSVGDLERVGFEHRAGRLGETWLAAGDALADAPRTALHAIESGARAARSALGSAPA